MSSIEKVQVILTIPLNTGGFCILCGRKSSQMVNIKEEHQDDLLNKIEMYIPIKFMEYKDSSSIECCLECTITVRSWHNFVLKVLETNRRLSNNTLNTKLTSASVNDCSINRNKPESTTTSLETFCQNSENNEPENLTLQLESENDDDDDEAKIIDSISISEESEEEAKNEDNSTGEKKATDRLKRVCTKIDPEVIEKAKVVVGDRTYYICENCGKKFFSPYTYLRHMSIHTGEKPFMCDLCGKLFRILQGLKRHLKETHKRIKNFSCDFCGRMFATKSNVEEHRRIHTNERPYDCSLCGKSFRQRSSLFHHNRTHSNNFPFKCEFCDKGFHSKHVLLSHINKHTGQKPHSCDVCGRCFGGEFDLKRHKLVHSEEKPFVCSVCGLKFKQKRYLGKHLKTNHTEST